ncbi:MAG: o-succinylbenzoate synthase [Anaerolineaceae bacterium]|nr:o-succinylbenzoate synthase [Anaerolineaceae bacterium]
MQIERVDLWITRLQLVRPFVTSSSRREHLDHILVKAHADGLTGWGECASPSDPYYCEETTETCWHMLADFLVPAVLGRPWTTVEEVAGFYGKVRRNNFAKAGLEMACWDLLARARGLPLHALLGGSRAEILSGVSLGIEQDPGRLLALVDRYLGEGYRRIKLKVGPGKDVDFVAEVRKHHSDVPLMVDANSAYTLADVAHLKRLDAFGLMMIEQPLAHDDIVDHARLQAELQTPICLDESIHSAEDARKALELGSGRIINVKVSRLGGLLEARRVHDYCHARGVPVWCGGMHEFGIGRAANVAISSLAGFTIPGDVSGSDKYYRQDVVSPPIRAVGGAIAVPDGPGLGYEPDEELIRRNAIRAVSLAA